MRSGHEGEETGSPDRRAWRVARTLVAAVVMTLLFAGVARAADLWSLDTEPVSAQEGVEFSGVVGCIELISGTFSTGEFTVEEIDWGDGTTSGGTIGFDDDVCPFISFAVFGTHTYAEPGTYTFRVEVSHVEGVTAGRTGTATVGVIPNDLAVSAAATPNPVKNGRILTYTATMRNLGSSIASDAFLTFTLSSGVQFQSLTSSAGACTAPAVGSTGAIVCDLGTLAGNTTVTLTVRAKVIARGGSSIESTASVGADDPDPFPSNNAATVATSVFGRR